MKTYFSFCHDYFKLKEPVFTTIRGASAAKQHKVGQEVFIIRKPPIVLSEELTRAKVLFKARIVSIEVRPIADIPLEALNADAAFKGFSVRSYEVFIGLLNSFRRFEKSKIRDASAEVAVFTLERI